MIEEQKVILSVTSTRDLRKVYLDSLLALGRPVTMVKFNKRLDD